MRDIVYFDLETRHSAAEVGGWHNTAEMRLSVGVTYSTASGKYTIYSEEMVDDLIRQLSQADLVVGYNHEHFDYGVLQRYTMWNMIDITNNLDLCKDIEQRTYERRIRKTKREVLGLQAGVDNAPNEKAKFALQQDLDRKSYLLQKQNAAYKDYCKRNGLRELQDRLMIAKWNRQNAAKARGAARRYKTAKGID